MKQVVWMVSGCVGSWLVAAGVTGRPSELFFGMLAPLAGAVATWLAIEHVQRQDPSRQRNSCSSGHGRPRNTVNASAKTQC